MKTKTCKTCRIEKTESDFYVHTYADGRAYIASDCKGCYNAKAKEYVSANRDRVLTSKRARREANKEEINRKAREIHAAKSSIDFGSLAKMKVCCGCLIEKPQDQYYFQKNAFSGGLSYKCKSCVSNDAKAYRKANPKTIALRKKKYREDNRERLKAVYKERHKSVGMKRKYGLDRETYDALILRQNNSCAICLVQFIEDGLKTNFGVDHCHNSKKVRSLLCKKCNSAIGLVKENVTILSKMIQYLNLHNGESNGDTPTDTV